MQALPLVSIIIPTWNRNRLLLDRCLPSVIAQTYSNWEAIVVSDGPDTDLGFVLPGPELPRRMFASIMLEQLPWHDPCVVYGSRARIRGQDLARGQFIAHLDDDNSWRPNHLKLLIDKLMLSGADFAYSRMLRHPRGDEIGIPPPQYGQIDTSLIVHRRELLNLANWTPHHARQDPDWELVSSWLMAGARWAYVPEITADYYTREIS